jgi:SAM-dependent methyltransferase
VADAGDRVTEGSALSIPHPDESFDVVVSIGCLHHTGDLAGATREVQRVLRPGGEAMVMVYNRHSFRQAVMLPAMELKRGFWRDRDKRAEFVRAAYDANAEGSPAPATEFSSAGDVRRMFSGFSEVRVRRENFDDIVVRLAGRTLAIPRRAVLNNVARVAGSDLYVAATK